MILHLRWRDCFLRQLWLPANTGLSIGVDVNTHFLLDLFDDDLPLLAVEQCINLFQGQASCLDPELRQSAN